jgi:tripartite-type tricarboxylate transporter receptor subunit TctC
VIDKLNVALRAALQDDNVKKRFAELSTEAVPMDKVTSEALRSHLAAEIEKWGKVIRAAGVQAD